MKIEKGVSLQPKPMAERRAEQDSQLREAAKMYEQHFMREMMKAMRQTIQESELTQSSFGQKIWRDQLDNEYVESWGNRGGVGLADMIYQHVKERYFPDAPRPSSPVGESWKGIPLKPSDDNNESSNLEFKAPKEVSDRKIRAPWDGVVEENFAAPNGMTVVKLRHDKGLVSRLVFSGKSEKFEPQAQVRSGETLGEVSGPAPWLQWKIDRLISGQAEKRG